MKTAVRRSSWIVTVSVAAAAVAYAMLSFLPERRAIGEARRQISEKQDYIVRIGGLTGALRTTQQQLGEAEAYNAAWEQHAPAEGELPAVYGRIYELGKAAGATVTRFDPEAALRYEKVSYVPLAVGCVGSFAEICGFLEGLEGLPLSIWVNELRLKGTGEPGESVSCEITLAVFANNSGKSDYADPSE